MNRTVSPAPRSLYTILLPTPVSIVFRNISLTISLSAGWTSSNESVPRSFSLSPKIVSYEGLL